MTPQELEKLCLGWNLSSEVFARLVAEAIQTLGVYQRELAREFQVADSTVSRWASGIARPHPRLQKLIVSSIRKRAHRVATPPSGYVSAQPEPEAAVGSVAAKSR